MAKKSKIAPASEAPVADAPAAAPAEVPAEVSAKSKRASLTLKSVKSGASFTFNVRPESRMKGGAEGPTLTINDAEVKTKVSSNERVAAEGRALWRFWIALPSGEFGYVITVPGESVEMFVEANGDAFTTESGRASRPDPKRELAKPIVRKPKEVAAEAPAEGEVATAK
jgi:hypothetical protein